MSKPTNFRRAKLVNFIRDQERLVNETAAELRVLGTDPKEYVDTRMVVLNRLKEEFDISQDEIVGS